YAQGYFVYDSRKAGSLTTSHLRFSPRPIKGSYLIDKANFVACHQSHFPERLDLLAMAEPGATFLLNSPFGPDEVWDTLPVELQRQISEKKLKFYVVDAYHVAREAKMGVRINTVMQTCFFKLAGVLPEEEAIAQIKKAIKKTYGKRGETVLNRNYAAVDGAIGALHEVKVPDKATSTHHRLPPVPEDAPEFVRNVLGTIIANKGGPSAVRAKVFIDATGDGAVSADDYAFVQANFGATGGMGSVSVPEPGTLSLLAIGGLAILRRRRK
ncbi:hypothetical protein LCGC14_2963570, partial [marine sediment metagenome]